MLICHLLLTIKNFGKQRNHCLMKKSGVSNEFVLLEKNKILRDDNEVAKEFHSY